MLTDGGRHHAGYKGAARDCACRAIAIATGLSYQDVYDAINAEAGESCARTGVTKPVINRVLAGLGWTWTPTMSIGSGCTVHLRADELSSGRVIVRVSRHLVAVIDGVIHDTHDSTRGGTRCVYGYWTRAVRT